MYYKKVWIIILIIVVVSSLFPSILIAKADEGEGEEGEIPDIVYSLQDAPFPGRYEGFTETRWQAFVNRAESLGHSVIKRITRYRVQYENGNSKDITIDVPIFYSTNSSESNLEYYDFKIDNRDSEDNPYYRIYKHVRFIDGDNANIINQYGFNIRTVGEHGDWLIFTQEYGTSWPPHFNDPSRIVTDFYFYTETWYNAEITNDPYQELPEQFNIDPQMGYGMYFIKPKNGETINIPYKDSIFRDTLELEIIVPQFYIPSEGLVEMLYEIKGEVGKVVWPNFVIRLYSNNVERIYGSKSPNDPSDWILQHDIDFVEGYYDEDGYMYAAKFKASLKIDHKVPSDGGSSLIVADLYMDYSNNAYNRQEFRLDDARTWVKYLTTVGMVDADGDGIDDRTGLPLLIDDYSPIDDDRPVKPDIDDYDSTILGRLSYYWDSLVYYVQLPFYYIRAGIEGIIEWISNIGTFIDSFTSIFDRLFSFLPAEVTAMLALGFSTMMIITIVRAIRGS